MTMRRLFIYGPGALALVVALALGTHGCFWGAWASCWLILGWPLLTYHPPAPPVYSDVGQKIYAGLVNQPGEWETADHDKNGIAGVRGGIAARGLWPRVVVRADQVTHHGLFGATWRVKVFVDGYARKSPLTDDDHARLVNLVYYLRRDLANKRYEEETRAQFAEDTALVTEAFS